LKGYESFFWALAHLPLPMADLNAGLAPQTLSARSLEAVAEMIKDGKAKRIVVMSGAGISTAAGSSFLLSPECAGD
jgi:hypothetical protein